MIHLAYPNVEPVAEAYVFRACVRYLALAASQPPPQGYRPASPHTPDLREVHEAVEELAPECVAQLFQSPTARLYETADREDRPWRGSSLDLAYLLALIHCCRSFVFDDAMKVGDVWCTGAIQLKERQPVLGAVDLPGFQAKVEGFFAQTHDRLFLVPKANAHNVMATSNLFRTHRVRTLAEFSEDLKATRPGSRWPEPTVVLVGTFELPKLVATLFQAPAARVPSQGTRAPRPQRLPRRPYKFLDSFGLADTDLFYGRDHDLVQLQKEFEASRLLILCGASGTGKTSLLQAGLLPSLPTEEYAWVLVRMVDNEPTAALKAALVQDFALDGQLLEQPLLAAVRHATATLGKTVVIILDQFEELFQRHGPTVRQILHHELRACLDDVRLPMHIVIALREDFFAQLDEFREDGTIPTIFHHIIRLTRFSPAQAYEAVVHPARQLGLPIDAKLVEKELVPRLTEPGDPAIDLPMLQVVCDAWYRQAEEAHWQGGAGPQPAINAEAFGQLGDIRTVLQRHLDATLREFPEPGKAREVLKALVSAEEPERAGKRAVFLEELLSRLHTAQVVLTPAELEHRFLRHLVQARLVRATEVGNRTRYELTHEFLVQQIGTWIAESERERTKVLELIDRAYEGYRATGLLLEPRALALIAPYQDTLVVPAEQRRFLALSRQTARRRRRRLGLRVVVLLLLVGLGVGGFFYVRLLQSKQQLAKTNVNLKQSEQQLKETNTNLEQALQRSETQRKLALRRQSLLLANLSRQRTQAGDIPQGILLALEALPKDMQAPDRPYVAEAEAALYQAVLTPGIPRQVAILPGNRLPGMKYAAFSPDGSRLVTEGEDNSAHLWNAANGTQIAILHERTGTLHAAFSPDGQRIVTAEGDAARLWDATTGDPLADLRGHKGAVLHAVFSPDGTRVLTASADATARLWNASGGPELAVLKGHKGQIWFAAFSPKGDRIITIAPAEDTPASEKGPARLWDPNTGKNIAVLRDVLDSIPTFAAFSPDGSRVITAADDNTARLWDTATGTPAGILRGHDDIVHNAAFSPDGSRIATASADGTVRVWQASTGKEVALLRVQQPVRVPKGDGVHHVAFSPDGSRIVTGAGNGASLWDATNGTKIANLDSQTEVWHVAFSPDGRRVVTVSWSQATLWEVVDGAPVTVLHGHNDAVTQAAFSPDGTQVVTTSADGTARLWETDSGALITVLDVDIMGISHTAFSPDGSRIVTASAGGTVRLWDAAGAQLAVLHGHEDAVLHTAFSPDGRRLVTTSEDRTARLWDATGGEVAILDKHEDAIWYAAFSPDGRRLVTTSKDRTARLWDTVTGTQIAVLSGHEWPVFVAAFSPDGSRIITGSGGSRISVGRGSSHTDYTAHLWDTDSGAQLAVLHGHIGAVTHAAFSPDGGRVVTGSVDSGTRLWDATDGTLIALLDKGLCLSHYAVRLTTFSLDGRRIITVWPNGTVHLWDTMSHTRLAMLHSYQITRDLAPCVSSWPSPYPEVVAAALSGDNRHLITMAQDGTARLLHIFPTTQALIDHARQLVPRQLTENERKEFFLY